MKTPALIASLAFLAACAQPEQTVKTPLAPAEALDVAAVPASSGTPTEDATCSHGVVAEERTFVICENGKTRKAGVLTALDQPADKDMTIETVAERYNVAAQTFTGIEVATYGNLVRKDRTPVPTTRKATEYETVTIGSKIYDVYHVGIGTKSGTIFVERTAK